MPVALRELILDAEGQHDWSYAGPGIRRLDLGAKGPLRLEVIRLDAGKAVPWHSHKGRELTLCVHGEFSDAAATYGPGDFSVTDGSVRHQPRAHDSAPAYALVIGGPDGLDPVLRAETALVLAFGFSLNQLTLFGLVLATGLVVDDAITVVEDTSAKKAEGMTSVQAAMATMDELFSAVIATSLVKMAVFLPVLFFPGATGTIYKQFAATILFSIGISTFNALTFSPMLAALLLSKETKQLSNR